MSEYREGVPVKDILAKHGGTKSVLNRTMRRHGLPTRRPGRVARFSDEVVADWGRRWLAGESQLTISREVGVSQPYISAALRRAGIEDPRTTYKVRSGEDHPSWRGGITVQDGYTKEWVAPDDDFAVMRNVMGYVPQHRLVMARSLGRPLTDSETVHHIDGDRSNNDLTNLQLRQGKHGKGVVAACRDCGSHNIGTAPIND